MRVATRVLTVATRLLVAAASPSDDVGDLLLCIVQSGITLLELSSMNSALSEGFIVGDQAPNAIQQQQQLMLAKQRAQVDQLIMNERDLQQQELGPRFPAIAANPSAGASACRCARSRRAPH
jgi:hypothetical protein